MKILIATDATPHGGAAVRVAAQRPWPPKSELRVMTVIEMATIAYPTGGDFVADSYYILSPRDRRAIEAIVEHAADSLRARGYQISAVVREGVPADEIIREARRWDADLIMVGTHGRRRISRFLLGSVAQRVAVLAPCSVEVVREKSRESIAAKRKEIRS